MEQVKGTGKGKLGYKYAVIVLLVMAGVIGGMYGIGTWNTAQDVTGVPGYLSVDVGVNPRSELAVSVMEDTPGVHYQYLKGDAQIDLGNSPTQLNPVGVLSKWDGAAVLSVSLVSDAIAKPASLDLATLAPKGAQVLSAAYDADTGINMYLLPNDAESGGGLEYEIVLDRQPTNSTIVLNLASDNLSFAYQPPMTEDYDTFVNMYGIEGLTVTDTTVTQNGEVMAYRPENVVGSYALFNTETREKFGQIYRPQLVDAKGDRAWAEQSITGDKLYIAMPQGFLDNASYPVIVDPSFGMNVGGTTYATVNANTITTSGLPFYMPGGWTGAPGGSGYAWWLYNNMGGTNHFGMAIYDSSLNLVVASTGYGLGASSPGYSATGYDGNLTLAAGSYYIAFNLMNSGAVYYDNWASSVYKYQAYSFGSWPATLSLSNSASDWQWSGVIFYGTSSTIYADGPTSYDFGRLAQSGSRATGLSYFTLQNSSGATITVSIKGTNVSTGSHTWTLSGAGTPGSDIYALRSGVSGGSYNHTVTTTNTTAWTGQITGSGKYWGLTLFAPTTYTLDTGVFVGTVTLTTAAE